MPCYCYTCLQRGHEFTLVRRIAQRNDPVECECGCVGVRSVGREWKRIRTTYPGTYPMECDSLGMDPEEVPGAMARLEKHGVRLDAEPDGTLVFQDRAHRKKVCEALGYKDNNAGYSDPQDREKFIFGEEDDGGDTGRTDDPGPRAEESIRDI